MKHSISFTLLCSAGALFSPAVQAQDSVQIYGQIRLSGNQIKSPTGTNYELRDNASRFGFRGREDLGGGMSALFGLEAGFAANTGAQADASSFYRNSYVGLRGSLGTVALGRLDSGNPTGSPLYSQVTSIISFAANDAGATAIGTSVLNSRNRVSNAIGYASPGWGGFDLRARLYLRGAGTAADPQNSAKSLDVGLNYGAGPLKAALGFGKDTRNGGLAAGEFDRKWQAGLRYSLGMVEPYVLVGADTYNNTAAQRHQRDYWLVGARFAYEAQAVVLNVMRRDTATLTGTLEREQLAYTYRLSKRTELQAFVDHAVANNGLANQTTRAIGAGIRHDF